MKCRVGELEIEGTGEEIYALAIRFGGMSMTKAKTAEAVEAEPLTNFIPDHDYWHKILGCKVNDFIREKLGAGADESSIATLMYNLIRDSGVKTEGRILVKEIYRLIEEVHPHPNPFKKKYERPLNANVDWASILGVSGIKYATRRLNEGASPEDLRNELFIAAEPNVNIRRTRLKTRCRILVCNAMKSLETKILEAKTEEDKKPTGLGNVLNNLFAGS
jgi:hypothetical protein